MQLGVMAMKGSANFGVFGKSIEANIAAVQRAEALGYDSVWTAEASGTDAVVPLSYLAAHTKTIGLGTAIMQMTARTPSCTAMTAATLDQLSGGRFRLGIGPSGPVVVEGWHSTAYGAPVARTREYVSIVRKALARTSPIVHHGEFYDLPYSGADATGLAYPIKLGIRPARRHLPIYIAAMGPRYTELAYRVADGVIPAFYSPWREKEFFDGVDTGKRSIDLTPFVAVHYGEDLAQCRDKARAGIAFWIGSMGARGLNFYNRHIARLGFEEAASRIQELYMSERRVEAKAAIPDELVDEVTLCGPRDHIEEQLKGWHASSVTTMLLIVDDVQVMELMAELVL